MKVFLRIAVVLVILCIGVVGGYWYASRYAEAKNFASDVSELEFYSAIWSTQMAEGTDATREEAIRGHLALIEKRKGHASPMFTEKVAATDSALGYARLSALAKKRGADQEASRLLGQAASYCPAMGWRECDAEKILSAVQQLDKQGIFGLGAP